jgi:hypothetical protein
MQYKHFNLLQTNYNQHKIIIITAVSGLMLSLDTCSGKTSLANTKQDKTTTDTENTIKKMRRINAENVITQGLRHARNRICTKNLIV